MMSDPRSLLERESRRFIQPDGAFERLVRRRDRKRRNQRIAAGVVGIAVFVAAVWIVTSGLSLDRSEKSVAPAGAGQVQTGPAETGPMETVPPALVEPAPIGTVTQSGAGCAMEIVAEPIHPGAGRLSVVNETNQWAMFELYRFDPEEITFAEFEALVANGENGSYRRGEGYVVLARREVVPGASGTITDYFTTGDAFAVVCLARNTPPQPPPPAGYFYTPIALVGPIVVP
jgi:hypothetical protein